MESRGEAHALTFSEVPYVAGLLLATPDDLLIGRLLGGFVILGIAPTPVASQAACSTWPCSPPRRRRRRSSIASCSATSHRSSPGLARPVRCDVGRPRHLHLRSHPRDHHVFSGWPGRTVVRQVVFFGTVAVHRQHRWWPCPHDHSSGTKSYTGILVLGDHRRPVRAVPGLHRPVGAPQEPGDPARLHPVARWVGPHRARAGRCARRPGDPSRGARRPLAPARQRRCRRHSAAGSSRQHGGGQRVAG